MHGTGVRAGGEKRERRERKQNGKEEGKYDKRVEGGLCEAAVGTGPRQEEDLLGQRGKEGREEGGRREGGVQ